MHLTSVQFLTMCTQTSLHIPGSLIFTRSVMPAFFLFPFFSLTSMFKDFYYTIEHKLKMWCPKSLMLRPHHNPHQEQNWMWTPFSFPLGYAVWLSQWIWQRSWRLSEKQDNSAFVWQQEKMQENTINSLLLLQWPNSARPAYQRFQWLAWKREYRKWAYRFASPQRLIHNLSDLPPISVTIVNSLKILHVTFYNYNYIYIYWFSAMNILTTHLLP